MKKFAGIWIPYGEIYKRFFGSRNGRNDKVYGQIQKEERSLKKAQIHIEPLTYCFSVCKVEDYSMVDLSSAFCFPQKTDEENSLVCLTEQVPENVTYREDKWKAFRIKGQMEFSLIGINTDYILVKQDDFEKAIDALDHAGYTIERNI